MIWVVVILGVVAAALGICLWIVWHGKSAASGAPTAEEARITTAAISEAAHLADSGAKQAEEIKNADRKKLFNMARSRMFRLRK